jgi:hypothetical protein
MKRTRRIKATFWGLAVGALFTGGWFCMSRSGEHGEPMLLPGQSRSTVVVEQLKTGAIIFIATSIPVALLVAFRPSTGEDSP